MRMQILVVMVLAILSMNIAGNPQPKDLVDTEASNISSNELTEEIGCFVLDDDWKSRSIPLHTLQKRSGKWMWCFVIKLTKTEYDRIVKEDANHDSWLVSDLRDLSNITTRVKPVRKEMSAFVSVDAFEMIKYIRNFSKVLRSENREADAKLYRVNTLNAKRLSTNELVERPMRAFNTVIFEEHLDNIIRSWGNFL